MPATLLMLPPQSEKTRRVGVGDGARGLRVGLGHPDGQARAADASAAGGSPAHRRLACAIVAAVVVSIANGGGAQPGPGRAAPPEVFSSSSCRVQYQRNVERIDAEHRAEAKGCRGNSACIAAANDRKGAGLKQETQKLLICQKTEEPSTAAPPPSRATPDPPPDFVKPDVPPPPAGGDPPATPPATPPAQPPPGTTPPAQPPVRPTKPGTWSRQGPEWVYTDQKGKPWLFKPSFKDGDRLYELDRGSVRTGRHPVKGDVVAARYVWRDRLTGGDSVTIDGRPAPGH